ncbi:helix-turn-helix domain-containing protein [Draconibacterium mangrovi]|uniref:helix-turn-helix domain-containing protein n=1 Tax=Draconibacterium mangrovi TaxID=2697469 RepID=UPI0013CF73E8|nr:helix-turn-helix domain-containing protein [Draconibacterium mangrovi]
MDGIERELRLVKRLLNRLLKSLEQNPKKRLRNGWMIGAEVKQVLHISQRTLQTWRENGTLPFSQISGKIYYRTSDVENLLNENYSAR